MPWDVALQRCIYIYNITPQRFDCQWQWLWQWGLSASDVSEINKSKSRLLHHKGAWSDRTAIETKDDDSKKNKISLQNKEADMKWPGFHCVTFTLWLKIYFGLHSVNVGAAIGLTKPLWARAARQLPWIPRVDKFNIRLLASCASGNICQFSQGFSAITLQDELRLGGCGLDVCLVATCHITFLKPTLFMYVSTAAWWLITSTNFRTIKWWSDCVYLKRHTQIK